MKWKYLQRGVLLCALALLVSTVCQAQTITGRVVGVADGDTLLVLDTSHAHNSIRLSGIDAPESDQAFGQASKRNLADLVFNQNVRVEWSKTDRYARVLGRVLLDGKDINLAQLKSGFAWSYRAYEQDIAPEWRKPYADAEAEAKAAKRGLWLSLNPQPPWEFRGDGVGTLMIENTPAPGRNLVGKIIGNKNNNIYQAPNCPDYAKVSERNRVLFNSEQEAVKAGYRKARNCP